MSDAPAFCVDSVPVGRCVVGVCGSAAVLVDPLAYAWEPAQVLELPGLDWAHYNGDAVVELIAESQRVIAKAQAAQ